MVHRMVSKREFQKIKRAAKEGLQKEKEIIEGMKFQRRIYAGILKICA